RFDSLRGAGIDVVMAAPAATVRGPQKRGNSMMRPKAAALALALTTLWSARALAEMPYPSNPQPCDASNPQPPCIEPTAFAQYLFLPATTPLTLPNDFAGGDAWKLTSTKTGNPRIAWSAP